MRERTDNLFTRKEAITKIDYRLILSLIATGENVNNRSSEIISLFNEWFKVFNSKYSLAEKDVTRATTKPLVKEFIKRLYNYCLSLDLSPIEFTDTLNDIRKLINEQLVLKGQSLKNSFKEI